jgi:hypothetical protein
MPPDEMEKFQRELESRLTAILERYFKDRDAAPASGVARLLSFLGPSKEARARDKARTELRNGLQLAYQVGGAMANNGNAMTNAQYQASLVAIQEAYSYLAGFLNALPLMNFEAALARLLKYIPPVVHFVSRAASAGLPKLPILPGDRRLVCSSKIPPCCCLCYLRVERVGPNAWDVFWVRTANESCPSCKVMAGFWNPLQIREGRLLKEGVPL